MSDNELIVILIRNNNIYSIIVICLNVIKLVFFLFWLYYNILYLYMDIYIFFLWFIIMYLDNNIMYI